MTSEQVEKFRSIFEGMTEAYGFYNVDAAVTPGEKVYGKRATVREEVTTALWEDHLGGEQGLGICPINKASLCQWGCIDVDVYAGLEHINIVRSLKQSRLPLVVCRTKSGGAHIYAFFKEYCSAETVVAKLKEVAACHGFGNCEIFPKQTKILEDSSHLGSWVNLPYFDGDNTTRYAYDAEGKSLNLDEFLAYVEKVSLTIEDFCRLDVYNPVADLEGGPPCIQFLAQQGVQVGTQNNALMAFAVFAKKKYPDDWVSKLEKYNRDYFDPAIPSNKVAEVIHSNEKREYSYRCKDQPICSHCNAGVCKTRQFGIGVGGVVPNFGSLQKLQTSPPIWFLQVEGGGVMELNTEELQTFLRFQRKCMDSTNTMPVMKQSEWCQVVQSLLEKVEKLPAPAEASPYGHFVELLIDYLSGDTPSARSKDEILLGYPYFNETTVFFQLKYVMQYLHNHNFKQFSRTQVANSLRKQEAKTKQMNIKGNCIRGYTILLNDKSVPKVIMPGADENDKQNPNAEIALPPMPGDVI